MELLAKETSPTDFKFLRPLTISVSSIKCFSMILLDMAQEFDIGTNSTGFMDSSMLALSEWLPVFIVARFGIQSSKCNELDVP